MSLEIVTLAAFNANPTDAELAYARNPTGATLDGGRIIVDGLFSGELCTDPWRKRSGGWGLWTGRQLAPCERAVLVSYAFVDDFSSVGRERHDTWIRYGAIGITPLVYFGYLDGLPPLDEPTFRRLKDERGVYPHMAMVEARPPGERLSVAGRLDLAETIRLGVGLCDTLLSLEGRGIFGLRPDTVYIAGERGNRYYAGAAPRAHLLLGYKLGEPDLDVTFDPPTPSLFDRSPDEVVYTVALLLWFGLLREHAFRGDHNKMWADIRAPFTGPPELGRLLEAVLVSDVEKRMRTPELRDELAKLAARWNIEPPPFPPPGLA